MRDMKNEIFQSLEKRYQPTAELIRHQRITIEKLEFDLEMSRKYFSRLVQVIFFSNDNLAFSDICSIVFILFFIGPLFPHF